MGVIGGVGAAQTLIIFVTIAIATLVSTKRILFLISEYPIEESISYYTLLQIINVSGREAVRKIGGVMMSLGFIIEIATSFVLISCFRRIPLVYYVCMVFLEICLNIAIALTLPQVIDVCNISSRIISRSWPRNLIDMQNRIGTYKFKLIGKRTKAQMPVIYYYWTAKFDDETRRSFYWNSVMITINLLLMKQN